MTSLHRRRSALVLAALLGAGRLGAADRTWVEVKSPHFKVVSDAGEKSARKTAWQFEQIRFVFEKLWPWARLPAHTPFVVVAVRDEQGIQALAPQYWEVKGGIRPDGVSVEGPDRCYVVLRADLPTPDVEGISPYKSIYWSYASVAIGSAFGHSAPVWFHRGLAELFSNTIVRDKDILVGRPIRWHFERLANQRLRLAEFLAVDRNSKYSRDEEDSRIFDSQSWAFVHYMAFGEEGKNGARLQAFAELLRTGKPQQAALAEAFGDPKVLEERLFLYTSGRLFRYLKVAVDVDVSSEGFAARTLPATEVGAVRAGVLAAMSRPREARTLLEEVRQAGSSLPAADEVEGLLFDRENKWDEAREAYGRAVAAGTDNYYACYRHAQLLRASNADAARLGLMETSLERAVSLNPDSAAAHADLADVKAELGKGDAALGLVRRAVELAPWDGNHRLVAARILDRLGQREDARKVAEIGLTLAKDDGAREHARTFLAYLKDSGSRAAAAGQLNAAAEACNAGDASACGNIVPHLERKCGEGEGETCRFLGWLHESGKGVAADAFQAFTFYQMACDRRDLEGCIRVAALQARGSGVPRDEAKARATLEPLCEAGQAQACTELAIIYGGKRTASDLARAKALLKKGCEAGDPRACAMQNSMPK